MRRRSICLLIAALMILSGCGGTPSQTPPPQSGSGSQSQSESPPVSTPPVSTEPKILKMSSDRTASTASPHTATTGPDYEITRYILSTPYRYLPNETGDSAYMAPELAGGEPVNPSGDQLVWQIPLSRDAKWENGDPITADDYIYSYRMILDPVLLNSQAGLFASNYIIIENATAYYTQASTGVEVSWDDVGIKKLDDYTLELTLSRTQSAGDVMRQLCLRYYAPVYESLYESLMNSDRSATLYGTDADKIISCGPYILTAWVKGSERVFARNPNYILSDLVKLDGINYRVVEDPGTQMQMFESGELDFIALASEGVEKYSEDPRVIVAPSRIVRQIDFNIDNPNQPILANDNFRRAMYYGVDRTTLARLTKYNPAPYYVSNTSVAYSDGTTFRSLPGARAYLPENNGFDPKKALDYFELALQETGLSSVSLTLNYTSTMNEVKLMSEYLQRSLEEIFGADRFKLELQGLPNAQQLEVMKSCITDPTSYELSWTGWGWSAGDFSPNRTFEVMVSTFDRRNAPYRNAEYDELYALSVSDECRTDEVKVAEITMEIEQVYIRDAMAIPVIEVVNQYLLSERLALPLEISHSSIAFGYEYADIIQ